jgi:signal transduction histidine kinase
MTSAPITVLVVDPTGRIVEANDVAAEILGCPLADLVGQPLTALVSVEWRERARERGELSQRLLAAEEAERARIAAALHDGAVQSLAALDLRLGLLQRQLADSGHDAAAGVDDLHRTVMLVATDLRDLLVELEPADEDQAVGQMLEEATARILADSDCRWSVTSDEEGWDGTSRLSSTSRVQARRIVKEAVLNVRAHAGATRVVVRVVSGAEGSAIEIVDDGTGFIVPPEASVPGSRGLADMIDRAAVSDGWCQVESDEHGTAVRVWMPYDRTTEP